MLPAGVPLARRINGKTNTARPDADGAAATDLQPRVPGKMLRSLASPTKSHPGETSATAGRSVHLIAHRPSRSILRTRRDWSRSARSSRDCLSMILGGAQGMNGRPGRRNATGARQAGSGTAHASHERGFAASFAAHATARDAATRATHDRESALWAIGWRTPWDHRDSRRSKK